MKRQGVIQNSPLYRYRYAIVWILLIGLALFMAVYRFWGLPSGLSATEMQSAARSGQLSLSGLASAITSGNLGCLVDLPWLVVQGLNIRLLGLSTLSVRLPAVILTLLSVILITILLRHLTKRNVAMMGGLLAVSSSFAISLSRAGVPAVMTTLLLTLLLLCGYLVINRTGKVANAAFVGVAVIAALLCYMSFGPLIVLTILLIVLLHPRLRLVARSSRRRLIVTLAGFAVLILPWLVTLVIGLIYGNLGFAELGLTPSLGNLATFAAAYAGFNSNLVGGLVVPMLTIVGAIMVVIGLVITIRDGISSVRFYTIITLMIVLTALGACQPGLVYLLFVPTIILETVCLGYLINKWYDLFPVNPYARVFAILPLAILIGSLCSVDMGRYFDAVSYNHQVACQFNSGLDAVNSLDSKQRYLVVVPQAQESFYQLVSRHHDNINVTTAADSAVQAWIKRPDHRQLVIMAGSQAKQPTGAKLVGVRTNWLAEQNVVATIYQADK